METVTSDSIRKAYRRYSNYYDLLFGAVFRPGRQKAIAHLDCQPGDRILEVGVGTGLSLNMYPNDVHLVGIDLSEDMLSKAQQKAQEQNLKQVESLLAMDAQAMEFPDNSFDKVVAMYVASVVPDVALVFQEIRRVCKPGGKIVVLNHFESKNPLLQKAEAFVQPLAKHLGFHPDFPMSEFLEKTGFQAQIEVPVNFLDYWTILAGENEKMIRDQNKNASLNSEKDQPRKS